MVGIGPARNKEQAMTTKVERTQKSLVAEFETLTANVQKWFRAYVNDAGNWNGTPLFNGNVVITSERADRGYLTSAKMAGLVETWDESGKDNGTGRKLTWVEFTPKGRATAVALGMESPVYGETVEFEADPDANFPESDYGPAAESAALTVAPADDFRVEAAAERSHLYLRAGQTFAAAGVVVERSESGDFVRISIPGGTTFTVVTKEKAQAEDLNAAEQAMAFEAEEESREVRGV